MSAKLHINGQSRDEIERLTRTRRRKDLLDMLARAVALDTHFTATEIAAARKLPKRVVIAKMKSGELKGHKLTPYRWTASLSAIREWDEQTAIALVRTQS